MNKVFRFLGAGALAVTFIGIGATNSFAQDVCADIEGQQAKYKEFTDNYAGTTSAARKVALNAAKEYVEKYGACPDAKQQVDYFKTYIPDAEKQVKIIEDGEKAAIAKAQRDPIYARFNTGLKNKNWDEVYAAGKELLPGETNPQNALDIMLVLTAVGFNEAVATPKNEKFVPDTLKYAADAIAKIEGGQTSKAYGIKSGTVYRGFETKDNALGTLNYIIGSLTYNTGTKDVKAALPYLYKASQSNSSINKLPDTFQLIGIYYIDEIVRLEKDRQAKLDANNKQDNDETKAIFAMQKGYAERAMDALAKAYQLTPATDKARKDSIYKNIEFAYEVRNGNKTGLNPAYISGLSSKPFVNPTTEVTPVVEASPTTDTTGTTKPETPATTPAKTDANTKPATTPAKPAATTKPAPASNTAAKTPAKKPAPKKKGTR